MLFYDIWKRQEFLTFHFPALQVKTSVPCLIDFCNILYIWILTILVKCISCSWNYFLLQKALVMLCQHTLNATSFMAPSMQSIDNLNIYSQVLLLLLNTKRVKTNSTRLERQVCNISFLFLQVPLVKRDLD